MTKYGIWTQQGQMLCPSCATKVARGMQKSMTYAIGVGYCDHCGRTICVDESLAREQYLVMYMRRHDYPDSWLVQTGGMCHAAEINFVDFAGHEWCLLCTMNINPSDPGEYYWYTELMNKAGDILMERDASSEEEIKDNIYWMQRNCGPMPSSATDDMLGDSTR